MVGRDLELALGERLLSSDGPWPRSLVLEGVAGIGKTTVWRKIVRDAEADGFRVLACRPAQAETKMAHAGIGDLLGDVPEAVLATLSPAHRRAIDIALLRAESDGSPPPPRMLATAVRSLMTALCAEQPLLIAVDDAHWLDGTSATVLAFALRRLGDARYCCLVTRRTGELNGFDPSRLAPPESAVRATIPALRPEALAAMLEDRLPRPLTRFTLTRIQRACDGNPFYALEIARALDGGDVEAGGPVPIPSDLRKLQVRRLRRLPPPTRAALLEASALSSPTTALVDGDALTPAEEMGIVSIDAKGRIAFCHPLFASAVYSAAPVGRRREIHRRLAKRMGDPEERARHLSLAVAGPDAQVAAMLEEAAGLARSRGAPDSAAELLERARELTPAGDPDARWRRSILAAELHMYFGDLARARRLLEETLRERCTQPHRAGALRLLAEVSQYDESLEEAVHLYRQALEATDDIRLMAAIELGLAYVQSNLMNWEAAHIHACRALDHARPSGDRFLEAQALAYRAMMGFLLGQGVDWRSVERSLTLDDPDAPVPLIVRPETVAALLHLYVGAHDTARTAMQRLAADASRRGDESDVAFVLLWRSWLETRSGRFVEASRLAREAAVLARLTGSESMHAWVVTQQAYIAAHTGDIAEARRCCAEAALPVERSGRLLPQLWIAATLALVELSQGDAHAALGACEPVLAVLEQNGIGEPVPAFFLPDAIEALIGTGQLDRAGRLLDDLEARGRELDRPWALATAGRCRGLLRAAGGDLPGALAAVDTALAEHERIDMPFERARTLLVRGTLERRSRRKERARRDLEAAEAQFDRMGAALLAGRARDELGRLGSGRSGGTELTPGERRTAERAAAGLTNQQVAAELFISPKTVESNLSRAYRKLDIHSRAELGAWLARHEHA